MRVLGAFIATLRPIAGPIAGAAWLLALYVFTAWIAIGTLGSIQIRKTIESDKKITLAKLENAQRKYQQQAEAKWQEIDALWSEIDQLYNKMDAEESNQEKEIIAIKGLPTVPESDDSADQIDQINDACSHVDINDTACATLTSIENKYEETFNKLGSEVGEKRANIGKLYKEIDQYEADFNASGYVDFLPVWTFVTKWRYRDTFTMPEQFLVLMLTMAMGALGSVVTLTWSFVNQDSGVDFRRYLFLPFVGTISALIIFVFVKAGQITISSGDRTTSLDPFFLSFVGIISGLLSERAYARIASVGRNFLKSEEDEARRWGVRLSEAVAAAGVSPADVAAYVGLDEDEVARVVNEKAPASLQEQRLIAACLRRSVRDLFTDIAPKEDQDQAEDAQLVEVPDLVGKDAATLGQALAAARLALGATSEIADSEHPPGHVVTQTPAAAARVAANSTVDVTVSSGPAS